MAESMTASEVKLMAYLCNRFEVATYNNLMANNPFQFLNGLIDAINRERDILETELHAISTQFNVSEAIIKASIEEAFNQVYNHYSE